MDGWTGGQADRQTDEGETIGPPKWRFNNDLMKHCLQNLTEFPNILPQSSQKSKAMENYFSFETIPNIPDSPSHPSHMCNK